MDIGLFIFVVGFTLGFGYGAKNLLIIMGSNIVIWINMALLLLTENLIQRLASGPIQELIIVILLSLVICILLVVGGYYSGKYVRKQWDNWKRWVIR